MTCPAFDAQGPSAIAASLRTVDCMSADATAIAFSRLFGGEGMLTAALTTVLTLYVGFFALALLTGRTSLSLSSLTPRMMGLGLALTFATSWIAYSQVIWTLLSAGPDSVAGILLGIKGSASQAFAARLDAIFSAVADAATQAQQAAGDKKGTTPADLLSYAALLLLLGTVGVLVTSRIALGALIALGPVFLIFSLFSGTRGLFEGWVRTAVTFALVPLLATLIGSASVAMLDEVVSGLSGGDVDLRQAAVVFVVAAVHCALMALALKLVTSLTAGWRIPFTSSYKESVPHPREPMPRSFDPAIVRVNDTAQSISVSPLTDGRVRSIAAGSAARPSESHTSEREQIIRLSGTTIATPAIGPRFSAAKQERARDISRSLAASSPISTSKERPA